MSEDAYLTYTLVHVVQIFLYYLRSNKVEKALRLALEMSKVVDKVLDFSNKEQKSCRTTRTTLACARGTSILGEVRNVEISRPTQQLLCSKSHDFLAIFALAHSIINKIAKNFDERGF